MVEWKLGYVRNMFVRKCWIWFESQGEITYHEVRSMLTLLRVNTTNKMFLMRISTSWIRSHSFFHRTAFNTAVLHLKNMSRWNSYFTCIAHYYSNRISFNASHIRQLTWTLWEIFLRFVLHVCIMGHSVEKLQIL